MECVDGDLDNECPETCAVCVECAACHKLTVDGETPPEGGDHVTADGECACWCPAPEMDALDYADDGWTSA